MNKYDRGLVAVIWNTILERVNATRKSLESVECALLRGPTSLNCFQDFIKTFRDEFNNIEKEATAWTWLSCEEIDEPRKRKKKCN